MAIAMGAVKFADTEMGKLLRGVIVVLAAAFMILPAIINYELWSKVSINPVVSMAISLQLFAIGIILFILAVGKEKFTGKSTTTVSYLTMSGLATFSLHRFTAALFF